MKKIGGVVLVLWLLVLPCFAGQYPVIRVVDGDTIDIDFSGKRERIRLLNVDTPESVHPDKARNTLLGKKASDYTRTRLMGKTIDLEFDGKKRGKYGRLLAYVMLDGINFNLELVHQGWSPYYTKYGESRQYHQDFTQAQAQARSRGLNIWTDPGVVSPSPPLTPLASLGPRAGLLRGNSQTRKFHTPDCRYFQCKACTQSFSSRNAALKAGYLACRLCSP